MARKKELPKPFFSLRGPFADSLEHFCQQASLLLQTVEIALEHGQIGEKVRPIIEERVKALHTAIYGDDSEDARRERFPQSKR